MTDTTQQTEPRDPEERRQYHAVRAIFLEALERIEPFFDPDKSWGHGTMDHLAYRSLHESYPHLSPTEVHVLVTAAKRYFAGERKNVARAD